MKFMMTILGLIVFAGQAAALSCMRPDPIATFNQVAAAPEPYFVLYGRLHFDESALPQGLKDPQSPDPAAIAAEFVGMTLTSAGFVRPYESPVELLPVCAGPWCGSARTDVDAIYFVRADKVPVMAIAEPCGGMIFANPSPEVLDALTVCMQGGACLPQPLQ
ncbi:hypothetical protein [Yoonia sediminilitoris]|uniref:Uncharacterized protein n=1 Tax=Yoonia sediminilitoris TaxID=1286148 RepID=A0A2T6KPU8_9RHOB|nr:hypothetical protein [Yoonia sediminilitoris]PUB18558.1 hypothetical protein C8N45_101142 [Yoonia sediminilitoris]RCW98726.1 hypothetical protein DFP92_101142 [Yoonia sediminilitoris]